jgi:hypothetical protein
LHQRLSGYGPDTLLLRHSATKWFYRGVFLLLCLGTATIVIVPKLGETNSRRDRDELYRWTPISPPHRFRGSPLDAVYSYFRHALRFVKEFQPEFSVLRPASRTPGNVHIHSKRRHEIQSPFGYWIVRHLQVGDGSLPLLGFACALPRNCNLRFLSADEPAITSGNIGGIGNGRIRSRFPHLHVNLSAP